MNFLLHRLYAHNFKQLTDVQLHFPERGTVLIEGANEAGKSSLFEAVYFALYGEGLMVTKEGLRNYGADTMRVELDFSIDGRRFRMARSLVGNHYTHRATLTYTDTNGEAKPLTQPTAVKNWIRDELRLSSAALLNTCFVEQKRLERLEELDISKRKESINELLNLRVLSNLATEFKITREDTDRLRQFQERVRIARLDADLPDLQKAVWQAERCLRFMLAREQAAIVASEQAKIDEKARAQEKIEERQAEIKAALDEWKRLDELLKALATDLTLRVHAWQEAAIAREKAGERVAELETLQAALPEREARLNTLTRHLDDLRTLEALEHEAAGIGQNIERKQQALAAWDNMQRQWKAGNAEREHLAEEQGRLEAVCEQAETRSQTRQTSEKRIGRIALLNQHLNVQEIAESEAVSLAEEMATARKQAEKVPILRQRLTDLTTAETRLREREEAQRNLRQNAVSIERATEQQNRFIARRARIAGLEAERQGLETKIAAQEEAVRTAAIVVQDGRARETLCLWAEAAERSAEADPEKGRLAELETRRTKAQERIGNAQERLQGLAARQALPGYALGGAGILTGVGGLASGLAVGGLVLGILLLIVGAGLVVRSLGAKKAILTEQTESQRELDRLEGERKAMDAQVNANAARKQEWAQREADYLRALESLGMAVPANATEARSRLASLPGIALPEAEEAHRAADSALNQSRAACDATGRTLETEYQQAAGEDPAQNEKLLTDLTDERDLLQTALTALEDLPQFLAALQVNEDNAAESLTDALKVTRREEADCAAQERALRGLEHRRDEALKKAGEESKEVQALARELELPGATPAEWHTAAIAEREAFRTDKTATPDTMLQGAVQTAREAVRAGENLMTTLDTEQGQRREFLEATPRHTLENEEKSLMQSLTENTDKQSPLLAVRPTLQADALPMQSAPLASHLVALTESLKRDGEEVAKLPAAQKAEAESATMLLARTQSTQTVWTETLPEPFPPTPASAQERLPQLQTETQAARNRYDAPNLRGEAETLQSDYSLLGQEIAACRNEQNRARKEKAVHLAKLGADAETPLETLPARMPEIAHADDHEADGWQARLEKGRNDLRDNRSQRDILARQSGVDGETLGLETEQAALADAEKAFAVKKRAGVMVENTRQSIVNRVMPLTMNNMRQVLPLLTEGRYQDVKWDEADNALDVYDNRARDYQRKKVFSGGAKDQISLALRLAFALATLPGELNVRPGWLFLDEPLSSFDRSRTQSLVDLLTRGLIRQEFAQVFLVSHSESFDPNQFDYRIRMDGGRVAETNLPTVLSV